MATSGTVVGNNVGIGSGYARVRVEWQLAGQNVGGNYSSINWQGYVDFVGADAQLDNGHVDWQGGPVYNNGGRVYNYAGNFSNHTIGMGSGSFNIGHDGAGNATLYMSGSIDVYASGTSSGAGYFGLPTIPRNATITFFNQQATDSEIDFQWGSSDNVSAISWWSTAYDGGGHHDSGAGGTGPFSVSLTNLLSETTYDITVAVQRADSGLWTNSGTANVTTGKQNNFFGRIGP